MGETSGATKGGEGGAEGGVAELVDLEQELCSLRRGLTQVEGLTPSTDPFGDSFLAPSPVSWELANDELRYQTNMSK